MTRVDATLRLEGVMDGPFMVVPSQTVERDCIVRCEKDYAVECRTLTRTRFIDRTGNEPLRKGVCIVCARSLFLFDLDACAPHELPAQELLHPTHPNPAHELHDGMLLHLEPSRSADEQTYACKACLAKLRLWQRPALSLANNMWIGRVPFALSALTFAERLLVALYLPAAYVVKLYPRRRGRTSWDEESIQKGMKGNVSTYRLPSSQIADMVAGNIMPRPAVVLAATVSVTFVGGGKTPLTVLPGLFCVRRGRVLQALRWLRANNRLYECVEISDSRLAELPEDGVPEEISSNVRYSDDVDAAQREHASYVPLDDDGETYGSDEECSELGDGEERLAEGTDRGRGAGDEDGDEELHTFDPHVFPLEANGSVDVAGDTVTDADLFAYAADNLMQTQQPAYAVRRGSTFVNEYAREDNGVRTDGGPTNPNHMMGAFPRFIPIRDGRTRSGSYSDGRFRRDFYFMFLAFGVVQKRQVCRSAALQVKRSVFVKYKSAFARLTAADFKAASAEEARRIPISNPVVRALRRQLTTLRSRVAGTDESRIAIRAQVWGMTLRFNPPSLWATINPADTADPIAQVLAGADIDLDRFVATAGPDSATRSRRIAADPFAAAEFFHYAVTVILEEIFGISVSPQGKIHMKLVTNGADTRDITFYITLYIAKRQVQAANASALLAAANAFNARLTARQAECRDRHKRLIQQCANALSRQHEFSAPEVVSYLMGWGDRYLSHSYVRIYWDTICGMLRDRFPELNESYVDDRVVDSTMRVPDAADTEPLVPIIASEGVFKLTDQLKEYTDRGDELDDMSFYDYFVRTRDGSVVADTDNRPCEGGRVPNHRVPYLRSSGRKRCRVLRDVEQEVNLHFIGRWFPRATDPNRDMYAAQMLLLLMPWRHLEELKGNETSFGDMLDTFLATASPRVRAIVENIQYFYDCSDRAMERTEEAADGAGTVEEDDRADVLDISAEGPPPLTDAAVTDADIRGRAA
ncbi:ATP-dependent DNA helicase [Mycena kentingensis (nom. inval.)]|nr:ATP-dependent DNA helicase [Mycena kentingensis (nom. inval.)]